jgi:hypothetical protein
LALGTAGEQGGGGSAVPAGLVAARAADPLTVYFLMGSGGGGGGTGNTGADGQSSPAKAGGQAGGQAGIGAHIR